LNHRARSDSGGESGTAWNAELYDAKHSFVWKCGIDLIELLAPQANESVLDLGCGTGHLTRQIASRGAQVLGIDSSADMILEARKNYPQLRFEVADARDFQPSEPFDAVFSNAALHWMKEPQRVAESVRRVLKTEGRFVAEFGGKGNLHKLIDGFYRAAEALGLSRKQDPLPWYFPSLGEYASLLEGVGFDIESIVLFDRPTPLEDGEAGLRTWITMFGGQFFSSLSVENQEKLIRRIEDLLQPEMFQEGRWVVDYRRLRVKARRT
jgi:trans-aconitate methyltransferase